MVLISKPHGPPAYMVACATICDMECHGIRYRRDTVYPSNSSSSIASQRGPDTSNAGRWTANQKSYGRRDQFTWLGVPLNKDRKTGKPIIQVRRLDELLEGADGHHYPSVRQLCTRQTRCHSGRPLTTLKRLAPCFQEPSKSVSFAKEGCPLPATESIEHEMMVDHGVTAITNKVLPQRVAPPFANKC
eukprot:SAG31_NODE_3466_length_4242_cov_9.396573_3_plen_188_part_00